MNTSHNCSGDLALIRGLNQVFNVIAFYVLTPVSAFGFILNLLTVTLLARSKLSRLNTTFYESFFCRCFCDIIVCLFGITNMNFVCVFKCNLVTEIGSVWSSSTTYEQLFFIAFIEFPGVRISLLASVYSEISLILNR